MTDPSHADSAERASATIHPPNDEKASEWITALAAAGFDYWLAVDDAGWSIHVPPSAAEAARAEIAAYEADNQDWPPAPAPGTGESRTGYDTWTPAWVCGFLIAFYFWLGPSSSGAPVLQAAAANSERILAGEWWRLVTALTVHSGAVHLVSNVIAVFFLGNAVARVFGGGLGWTLILGSGASGNAAVAFLLQPDRVSVGASTACFGALGIMAAYQAIRKLRQTGGMLSIWDRTWIPLGAGLALLAMLGTGPQSDLAGHACGFLAGIALSVPFTVAEKWRPPRWCQLALELACLTVVLSAWRAAFASVA